MNVYSRKIHFHGDCPTTVTLDFNDRQKSRLKTVLDDGTEAGIILERGQRLFDGDILEAEDGSRIRVVAAIEALSCAHCDDPLQLARCCYHLGNRHVPLQIQAGTIRWQSDHVLDDMVTGMGLTVSHEQAPFQPEHGAYHHEH